MHPDNSSQLRRPCKWSVDVPEGQGACCGSFEEADSKKAMSQAKENRRRLPPEPFLWGLKNRILQGLVQWVPGAFTLRVLMHRWRGVRIGTNVHIGFDVLIETAYPQWVSIGSNVQLGIRSSILAHLHGMPPWEKEQGEDYVSVRIEDDAYIGPGAIILPNVTIGRGAVVTAGSVVTRSVPPMTMVQGNPARPIAHCEIPLTWDTAYKEFLRKLKPLKSPRGPNASS